MLAAGYSHRMDMTSRLNAIDWQRVETELDAEGWSVLPALLDPDECDGLAALWDADAFRKHIVMARHGYGQGEYRYFAYPLPDPIQALRSGLYPHLAPIANRWNGTLGTGLSFPADHALFLAHCHAAGQARPTPLILRYGAADYNCLHQDLYGEHVFPLQAVLLLSKPGADFTGGEFLLTEQRPRRQSRGTAVALGQGDAIIFAVRERPVRGSRGYYRTAMRHGVSTVHSGDRRTIGIIFHDAS